MNIQFIKNQKSTFNNTVKIEYTNLSECQAIDLIACFIEDVDHVHAEKIVNKIKSDFVYSFIISNIQYAFIYDAINSET